ncbi:MAG: bifunctional hydroxymethylpyrimidine kinase/phosphomethylpyrimidine kinase [Bauldia sp.]
MTPIALTIAGSDSGGGAGIQADLKTFAAFEVYGASAITALTAQNTRGVFGVHDVPPAFVAAQIDAVVADMTVGAVKIGMLSQPAVIRAVAERLKAHRLDTVVLDPVMVAASGDPLIADDAVSVLIEGLLPLALVVTPNLAEAARLTRLPTARSGAEMEEQAAAILALGPRAVLVKGGHGSGAESADYLLTASGGRWFTARRIDTPNTHGTGCTLSSGIAAGLARGKALETAVGEAKAYLTAALVASTRQKIGGGRGPVHHFHAWWQDRS